MKKTIYLHIGIGKTATSAIQKSLYDNKDKLSYIDFYIPKTGLSQDNFGHHLLANIEEEEVSTNTIKLYQTLEKELCIIEENNIIISSEYFCYCKPSYIKFLKSFFDDYEVKIIFFVREQVKLLESTYLQWQAQGHDYKYKIDNFFKMASGGFNYIWMINNWSESFGKKNIIVKIFDKHFLKEGIMKYFFQDISNSIDFLEQKSIVNKSLLPCYSKLISFLDINIENLYSPNKFSFLRKDIIDSFIIISSINIEKTTIEVELDRIYTKVYKFSKNKKLLKNYFYNYKKNINFSTRLIDESLMREVLNYYEVSNNEFSNQFLSNEQKNIFMKNYK